MAQDGLAETLHRLVVRHGMSSILRHLANIQSSLDQSSSSSPSRRPSNVPKRKVSAVDYVRRMTLPPDKAEVMHRAAEHFESKSFLPTIADVREFCRVHGVEPTKTASRVGSIPRVFTFLATMDIDRVTRILDEGPFSGPTRLAPIADAIRGYRPAPRHGHRDENAMQAADLTAGDTRGAATQEPQHRSPTSTRDKKLEKAI